MHFKLIHVLLLFLVYSQAVNSEFITAGFATAGAAIAAGLFSGFDVFRCMIKECCTDKWISTNFTGNYRLEHNPLDGYKSPLA